MLNSPELRTGFKLILKSQFLTISAWLIAGLVLITWLSSEFSGRQPATVALDIGISFIRLALPILAIILIQEIFSREFDRKLFLTSLSYPRSRQQFLLGRFFAVTICLVALLISLSGVLGIEVYLIGLEYAQATPVSLGSPYIITILFFSIELILITAFATLLSITASTPSFVLIGTIGFVLASRSFSAIIALLQNNNNVVAYAENYQSSLSFLAFFLPDLYNLDVRAIALYGKTSLLSSSWGLHITSVIAYCIGLLVLSIWLLNRKRFS